jgi:hypothetical protein
LVVIHEGDLLLPLQLSLPLPVFSVVIAEGDPLFHFQSPLHSRDAGLVQNLSSPKATQLFDPQEYPRGI